MKQKKNAVKTSPKLMLGYGMGEVGSQTIWYMINSYLLIFYTDVLTISAGAISMIMIIARIWDAVNDPMMGMLCDRTRTKWGKFRPYIMFATPVLAIFNVLTFTVFPVQGPMKAVLALVFYVCAGMAYTVVSTAYAGLVNVLSKNSQIRQNLSAARTVGSSAAQLLLSLVAMPLILLLGHSDTATAQGYFKTVLLFSVIAVPCLWITAGICRETYTIELHSGSSQKTSIFKSLKHVFKNRPMVLVILSCFFVTTAIMGRLTLLSYHIIYVMGSYTLVAAVFGIISVSGLIFSLLIPFFTSRLGKKTWLIILCGIMIIGMLGVFFTPADNIPLILFFSFLSGAGNSGQGVIFGMMSDSIDYGDYKYGIREEGIAFSFITFGVKIAGAIVGAVGILLLAQFGYVPNAEQTEVAKQGINMVVNIIPAVAAVLGLIPIFLYNLNNKRMDEIGEALEKRRSPELKEAVSDER